jgi:hypothetical protein
MNKTLVLLSLIALAPGCGAPLTDESDDPELNGVVDDGKADSLSSTSTYYSVRRDFRKCAFPLCGGYYVSRVNRATTTCHDGSQKPECYVVNMDLENTLGLDATEAANFRFVVDQGQAVLRGKIKKANYPGRVLGFFVPTEGYAAATTAAPAGTFYRATDSGIRCFRAPCPSVHQAKLNSTSSANIYGLDLDGVGATEEQVSAALNALSTRDLLVAGNLRSRVLEASQFYLRVRHVACTGPVSYPSPPKAELEGGWSNNEANPYPRTYAIANDSTFVVSDAVAPCPAGAVCIWSGIVTQSGTWSVVDDSLALVYDNDTSNGFGISYFKELKIKKTCAGKLELHEERNDGSNVVRVYTK